MLLFSPLTGQCRDTILTWPPYEGRRAELDYVIRNGKNSWLSKYYQNDKADCRGVWRNGNLIGLVILHFEKNAPEPEINIAVHPTWAGKGTGTMVLKEALKLYFGRYPEISNIRLVVRKSNVIAKHVYDKIGFIADKEFEAVVNEKPTQFYGMFITRDTVQQWD